MKQQYLIHDAIGLIGTQIAGTSARAVELFGLRHDLTLAVKPVTAHPANRPLPREFNQQFN